MRTTLDLPQDLMEEALKVSNQRSKTAVIIEALQELVRQRRLSGLKAFKGNVALDVDLASLRKRR